MVLFLNNNILFLILNSNYKNEQQLTYYNQVFTYINLKIMINIYKVLYQLII